MKLTGPQLVIFSAYTPGHTSQILSDSHCRPHELWASPDFIFAGLPATLACYLKSCYSRAAVSDRQVMMRWI